MVLQNQLKKVLIKQLLKKLKAKLTEAGADVEIA